MLYVRIIYRGGRKHIGEEEEITLGEKGELPRP